MDIQSASIAAYDANSQLGRPPQIEALDKSKQEQEVREAFHDFVGQTFFSHLLAAMRKTVGEPAYFHGGRTEEIFQGQLDQVLSEKLSDASAEKFSEPMYQLFTLPRR